MLGIINFIFSITFYLINFYNFDYTRNKSEIAKDFEYSRNDIEK